ncbi:hypothetical protein [Myxosarcina sp. GI1(2024)]
MPATAQSETNSNWLEGDFNWNQVGASLPQAPPEEGQNLSNCQHTIRSAVLPEDRLVEAAGFSFTLRSRYPNQSTLADTSITSRYDRWSYSRVKPIERSKARPKFSYQNEQTPQPLQR